MILTVHGTLIDPQLVKNYICNLIKILWCKDPQGGISFYEEIHVMKGPDFK